jgi:hypothetical protein
MAAQPLERTPRHSTSARSASSPDTSPWPGEWVTKGHDVKGHEGSRCEAGLGGGEVGKEGDGR